MDPRRGLLLRDVVRAGSVSAAARGPTGWPPPPATLVPRALARLRAGHPGLDVVLTEAEPSQAQEMVVAGDVDLALLFGYGEVGAHRAGAHRAGRRPPCSRRCVPSPGDRGLTRTGGPGSGARHTGGLGSGTWSPTPPERPT